ncbi:MAG: coenzyme F420-0:L-glutamate ligase [Eubacteriales bacterium]|jgi:F420-0:gamma-glutamyl ligase-like protein
MSELKPNEGKNEVIEVDGKQYGRYPIKTHVITDNDRIPDVAEKYAAQHLREGDILFISEKAVACSQKRAVPLKDIKPSRLARLLSRFVYRSPYGIGLSMPETMEMALRECGVLRILFAAFISAIGKLFGKRGWFYRVAGYKAESIDGPTPYTLPPYNEYVVLGPQDPDKVAAETSERVGVKVLIVDINDLAGRILGSSDPSMDRDHYAAVLKDNPLGQSGQQTPMGIIRELPQTAQTA